jgi:hypothetical protein
MRPGDVQTRLIAGRSTVEEPETACELLTARAGAATPVRRPAVLDAAIATGRKRLWRLSVLRLTRSLP